MNEVKFEFGNVKIGILQYGNIRVTVGNQSFITTPSAIEEALLNIRKGWDEGLYSKS